MLKQTKNPLHRRVTRVLSFLVTFSFCGTVAFIFGLESVGEWEPESAGAQLGTTSVNIILQYNPVGGGDAVPIEVTQVMNGSQTPLLHFIEVHTGAHEPPGAQDRCSTTNAVGRCNLQNLPVGGDLEAQYDIIVNTDLIEFVTQIPLEPQNAFVRFDQSMCRGSTTSFTGDKWCLTSNNGVFAAEYNITISLGERDLCTESNPPAPFCDASGRYVTFRCNPSFSGPTIPFEPVPTQCDSVQCPDGNFVRGMCDEVVPGVPACSTAAACRANQLCNVRNVSEVLPYTAGDDFIVIRGEHFGTLGGEVAFPTRNNGTETVEVFPGADWRNTQIRVPIPVTAVSGKLSIHPHSHGNFDDGKAVCETPQINIRGFDDQFALLSVAAQSPNSVQLVSPGYDTVFTANIHHNERVSRLKTIEVRLLEGFFPTLNSLPLDPRILTQTSCSIDVSGSANARDAISSCTVPIPENVTSARGPFTFLVILYDDLGESDSVVLVDSGESAMAGDFNFDHRLTAEDAVIAIRLVRGVVAITEEHLLRDPNNDGEITTADALFVLHSLTSK